MSAGPADGRLIHVNAAGDEAGRTKGPATVTDPNAAPARKVIATTLSSGAVILCYRPVTKR